MSRTIILDCDGKNITCMKEFDALEHPCDDCDIKDCLDREIYDGAEEKIYENA